MHWPTLTAQQLELDSSTTSLGELRSSDDIASDLGEMRGRLTADGYLYLPGFLDRDAVLRARTSVTDRLHAEGFTDSSEDPDLAVAAEGAGVRFKPDLAHDNPALHGLLYQGRMIDLYERLLGGPVRHFDYTWMRAMAPGRGTPPHADVVFMGRGTHDLYTSWVPLGDADFSLGGLMLLEASHQRHEVRHEYGRQDVDTYCENVEGDRERALARGSGNGSIDPDPVRLRNRFGGRWLTTEYRAGDLLLFSIYLVHASLDNHSRHIRLSSDSRYQLASAPIDERWIGEAPIAHGPNAKRGLIC